MFFSLTYSEYTLQNPVSLDGVSALDSERPFERTSSGEYAVSLVSDEPWGEAGSLVEPGLLKMRYELLDRISPF